jgi:hypothetical protein
VAASHLCDVCEFLRLYALVDFFAVHSYVCGGRKAETQVVALDAEHSDSNVIADLY